MAQKFTIDSKFKLNSGYEIPLLGYGVFQTPPEITSEVVQQAMNVGYRHVDSAAFYRNESGSADGLIKSGISRDQLFFTTKVPPQAMSYDGAKKIIAQSLKNIGGLNYIDLVLLHSPYGGREGRLSAWKALVEAVESGTVRSIGVSNYGVQHLEELEQYIKATDAKEGKGKGGVLSVNQVELHPWLARKDIDEWCKQRGVLMQAWGPLARATRWGDPVLDPVVKRTGKTPAQVLVRWSLQKGFNPLPKSVNEKRIKENADVYDFELTAEDMKALDTGEYSPSSWDPTKDSS